MPFIDRPHVSNLVFDALHEVADFASNDETFDFSKFTDYHKYIFINKIAFLLSKLGLCVVLSIITLTRYPNMKGLIDYISDKQVVQAPISGNVSLP